MPTENGDCHITSPPDEKHRDVSKPRGLKSGKDHDKAKEIGSIFVPMENGLAHPEEVKSASERKKTHV